MELLNDLNWRYAVNQFSNKKIPSAQLKELLNATRLSASSYGLQPYKILIVESDAIRQQLIPFSYGQDKVAYSSHLIVFAVLNKINDDVVERYIDKCVQIAGKTHEELSRFSGHMKSALANKTNAQKQEWAHQQAYIALGNFLTCAAVMKIDSCPMTGFDNQGLDNILGLSEYGLTSSIICPVGYRHKEDQQANSPKIRYDYDEIIMEL